MKKLITILPIIITLIACETKLELSSQPTYTQIRPETTITNENNQILTNPALYSKKGDKEGVYLKTLDGKGWIRMTK